MLGVVHKSHNHFRWSREAPPLPHIILSSLPHPLFNPARAESATSVTGRLCPHSGEGKTFWRVGRVSFRKTTITRKRKVEKSFRRSDMSHLSEGYRRVVDKIWGRMESYRIRFSGPKKSVHFLMDIMFWPRPGKVVQRKKYPFPK